MKKILLTLFIAFSALLFADNFKPQLHITPSVRQQGFGGFYTTDVDNFYGLYANPAMLGTHKKHSLFPGLGLTVSGPFDQMPDFFEGVSSQDLTNLAELLRKNNGLKFGMNVQPLLSMGHVSGFGFGWGLCTDIFMSASVPNLSRSDINIGAETVLTAGFGFPIIHTDNHLLTVGITAKGFFQMSTLFNEGIISVSSKLQNFDINDIPMYVTAGFGFDAGVYYSMCNCIDFAIVYHDPWSPAWVAKTDISNIKDFHFGSMQTLEPKLSAGIAWRVQTAATRGAITSLRIMADYKNIFTPFKKLGRNPWLELNAGAELVLANIVSFRVGLNELYPACGIGFSFGHFKIDMSMYGKELGLEPGNSPCLNAALFIGVTY